MAEFQLYDTVNTPNAGPIECELAKCAFYLTGVGASATGGPHGRHFTQPWRDEDGDGGDGGGDGQFVYFLFDSACPPPRLRSGDASWTANV